MTPVTTPWLPYHPRYCQYITPASEASKHQSRPAFSDHEGAWGALQASYGAPNTAAPPAAHEGYGDANYAFKWDVDDSSSGNFYGHQEERDGGNTQGRCFLACCVIL
ncbi:uncharacterized protein LOC119582319 [Penaeus monodon]|uniref:uncharacterized protein LOC119582319 n=1 Tax=Penaeus monodon TaxID=6687 RepID=UPI0018A7CECC|nr:uncharacterized protein LOC119582319 [Penaeus monodon]